MFADERGRAEALFNFSGYFRGTAQKAGVNRGTRDEGRFRYPIDLQIDSAILQ